MKFTAPAVIIALLGGVQSINIGQVAKQKFPEDLNADDNSQDQVDNHAISVVQVAQTNSTSNASNSTNSSQKSNSTSQVQSNQTTQANTTTEANATKSEDQSFANDLAALSQVDAPKEGPKAPKKSSIAHVPLTNINNQQYTGELYFGQPPQKVKMQFDTGSAIVYVLTNKCTENCNSQTKFMQTKDLSKEPALSQAGDEDSSTNRIEYGYGSGYINGYLAQEKICFAKDDSQPCIKGIKILEADQASGVEQDRFAGIIGLAPKSSEKQLQAFVTQVHDINRFSTEDQLNPQFSFYLSTGDDSSITFGGYDLAQYAKPGSQKEDIFWSNIVHQEKYWTVNMDMIGLADEKVFMPMYDMKSKYAIMDTGVSYAILPTNDFIQIKDALKSYGVDCKDPGGDSLTSTHDCTCKDHDGLPDIQIQLMQSMGDKAQKKMFTLPKESYMEKVGANGCGNLRLTPSDTKFGETSSHGYWVLGDIFLQNYYSIYDLPQQQMGLIDNKNFKNRAHAEPPQPKEDTLNLNIIS